MLIDRSIGFLLSIVLFGGFFPVADAHVETLHFYRSTGAGTWEQLPDIDLNIPGNTGSLNLMEVATGPDTGDVESTLSRFQPIVLKKTGRSAMCSSGQSNFFLNIPTNKKKLKKYKRRHSINKKRNEDTGEEYIEVKVNDEIIAMYSLKEWESLSRFDKLFFKLLGRNKAEEFSGSRRELSDGEVLRLKGISLHEAAQIAIQSYQQEQPMEDSWSAMLAELEGFDRGDRVFVDLVFGTNCNWKIIVYFQNGTFGGILFQIDDQSFLILFGSTSQTDQFRRRRSSPTVTHGRRRECSTSSEGSESGSSRPGSRNKGSVPDSPRGFSSSDSSYFQKSLLEHYILQLFDEVSPCHFQLKL